MASNKKRKPTAKVDNNKPYVDSDNDAANESSLVMSDSDSLF